MGLKSTTFCMGYTQQTVDTSTALTVPTVDPTTGSKMQPTLALIVCEAQAVRWRDDGAAPSSTVGMPLAVGVPLPYDGDLTKIRFISQTAGGIINVSYYA